MSACPCCGEVLLRHARHAGVYWFCTHCWQEMPLLAIDSTALNSTPDYQAFSTQLNLPMLLASR